MSTTSGNARAARAAARAARVGSEEPIGARSTGARSTAARSTRGRGSRRGASPAAAADPPEDDHEEIPAGTQAYGTQGRPDEVDMQAQLGQQLGVNTAVDAVGGAGYNNALATVNEEAEMNFGGVEPHIVQPPASIFSRFSNFSRHIWGPRNPVDPWEAEMRERQRFFNANNRNNPDHGNDNFGSVSFMIIALFTLFLYHTHWAMEVDRSPVLGNVTAYNYNTLLHRMENLEHYVHNRPTIFTSSTSEADTQINWFAPGFNPIIDVQLSSPTTTYCDPLWKPWPFSSLLRQKCPQLPISPPHKMALQSWDDPMQDRWCAPRSGGKLQLAIEIMRPIMPTELVVEFMSKQATPAGFMSMAPKEIELWIRVEDDDVRAKATETIGRLHPELLEDSSPQHKTLEVSRDLGPLYIPVGRWIYNIYDTANVQTFRIPVPLLEGVETTKLAIRVNSNWGSVDFTCLNRLRMHGVDISGVAEDLEDPPRDMRG